MKNTELIARQVAMIRDAAQDPESAYAIRSRLGRLAVTCQRLVAEAAGLPLPDRPTLLPEQPELDPLSREILGCANRMICVSRHLCQPSEPLDQRWRDHWCSLQHELDTLHALVG
jgi:hypothetical protein